LQPSSLSGGEFGGEYLGNVHGVPYE